MSWHPSQSEYRLDWVSCRFMACPNILEMFQTGGPDYVFKRPAAQYTGHAHRYLNAYNGNQLEMAAYSNQLRKRSKDAEYELSDT